MKKAMIITGLALAGATAYYFISRLLKKEEAIAQPRTHHLTDVFSKAKNHAIHN